MILYFNHQSLRDSKIQQAIIEARGSDTLSKLLNFVKYNLSSPPMYSRKGTNLLPFKTDLINVPGFSMPDRVPDHNKSWDEITDQRCIHLRKNHFDRPWTVMWSGGIDSTNIVTALIKNLPRADLDNITIACTPISVWENPHFYFDYIKPNFKIVNSLETLYEDFNSQNVYTIGGEPADQLFGGLGISLSTLYQNIDLLHKDIVRHSGYAIDFIAAKTDRNFAEWYYNVLMTSAQSAGIPVTTLHDMAWWSTFNDQWITVKFRFVLVSYGKWKNIKNVKSYVDKFVHWYDSNDYQQWAMNRSNIEEKLGTTVSDYKLAAKKYIYELDKNKYYFKYKTKMASSDIFSSHLDSPWCCITDNWDILNLEEHQDLIVSLLPDHFA